MRMFLPLSSLRAPALKSKFGYKNVMQIPTLTKVVVNMGVGEAARETTKRGRSGVPTTRLRKRK